MRSYGPRRWLNYYDMHAIMCAWYYTSCCIQQNCQLHFIAWSQVHTEVRSWLYSIVHSQTAWLTLPSKLQRRAQVHSEYAPKYTSEYSSTLPGMLSRTLPISLDGTLPACLTIRSQVSSQDASTYTPSTLPSTPLSMFSSWLTSMLPSMLLFALDGTLLVCLTVRSHGSSEDALKHTTKHALKYTPNCIWWHTPSLLGSTLPSTLPRGKTLPLSLDYMLPCMLLGARSRDFLSCRRQASGGGWWVAGGGRSVAGARWRGAGARWRVAGCGWRIVAEIMTSVAIIVWTLC